MKVKFSQSEWRWCILPEFSEKNTKIFVILRVEKIKIDLEVELDCGDNFIGEEVKFSEIL